MTQAGGYVDPRGVAVGCEVFTSDGEHVGTVKEVLPGYFRVDARLQPDFWLQSEFVTASREGRITMEYDKDSLGDYRVRQPPDDLGAPPIQMPRASPESGPGENIAAETTREAEQGRRET